MDILQHWLSFRGIDVWLVFRIVAYLVLGIILTLYVRRMVGRISEKHLSAHHSQSLRRVTFYVGILFSLLIPLHAFGINITAITAVTGIMTAAIAFASQTAISNFLSGIFLMAEKSFEVGDVISAQGIQGEVLAIGLLSVNIRTKDNLLIRMPNEGLLKACFSNLTRFPIRRCDIKFRVHPTAALEQVKSLALRVAMEDVACLMHPPPEMHWVEFTEGSVVLQLSLWCQQSLVSTVHMRLPLELHQALRTCGIQLPTFAILC